MAEKRTRADGALRRAEQLERKAEARLDLHAEDRRIGPIRSGKDRRNINIAVPPGSPVRSGLDRRVHDRRGADFAP